MKKLRSLSWRLRTRFEHWLWQGSVDGKRIQHWLAPRLPWYLSDVEAHYYRKKMKDPDWWDSLEPANVSVEPPRHHSAMRVINGVGYYKDVIGHPLMVQAYANAQANSTTGASSTVVRLVP